MRFGYLVAVKSTGRKTKEGSGGCFIWECLCDCGESCEVSLANLTHGSTKSCGCYRRNFKRKHGMTDTPTYRSWQKLLSRDRYESYAEWHGDVTVCERWDPSKGGTFANFLEDMGERPDGCTINRINGAKEYSKENCEWATLSVQSF